MRNRENDKPNLNRRLKVLDELGEAAALLDVKGQIRESNHLWTQSFGTSNVFAQMREHQVPEATIAEFMKHCKNAKHNRQWKLMWSSGEEFLATAGPFKGDNRLILLLMSAQAAPTERPTQPIETASKRLPSLSPSFSHNGHSETIQETKPLSSARRKTSQFPGFPDQFLGQASPESTHGYELIGLTQSHFGQEWKTMRKLSSELQATLGAEPVALATYCLEGLVLFWNSRAEEIYGWSESELFEKPAPFSRNHFRSVISCLRDGCGPLNSLVTRNRKDGSVVRVNQTLCPLFDAQRCLIGVLEISQELTAASPHPSRLNLELMESREAERASLAREMHDGPLQELISIGFCCNQVERELEEAPPDVIKNELQHLRESVLQVGRSLREVIRRLRPGQVEELGLAVSLEEFISRSSRDVGPSPEIQLELQEQPCLSPAEGLCLFRIAQEAFHNCLRHAHAENVTIKLWQSHRQVALEIRDDGKGFKVPSNLQDMSESEHYGLLGMQERSKLLGASFHLESTLGQGTCVQVVVNLDPPYTQPEH